MTDMKSGQGRVQINKLHLLAMQLADQLTTDEELRNRDVTDIYYDEKRKMLTAGELINCQFRGLPGSGKSTAMLAELWDTNNDLGVETTIDHVIPNQIVYIQVMRRITKPLHICIGVDEIDELGDTGYNATTDQAGLNSFSDLGRAYYIHRYVCSPKDTMDKNANIILDVIGKDEKKKFTRCLLSYKLLRGGIEHEQLLGHIDIDVSQLLRTKFYKDYYQRKMQRLKLFSKYGIVHERHIFFAKVLLDAYAELRLLASMGKVEKGMAELQIDISARKLKQVNSMLSTGKFTSDLLSLLQYVTFQEKEKAVITKLGTIENTKGIDCKTLINAHHTIREKLKEQESKVLEYWNNAASLEPIYVSNLGLEPP